METKENFQEELISEENHKKNYEAYELFEKHMHFMTDSRKISIQAKGLFDILYRHAGAKLYAMLSLNTLKKKTGWTIPTIRKYMKELVKASIVKIVHQVRKDGGYGCNRYYLSTDIKDWFRPEDYAENPMYKSVEKENPKKQKKKEKTENKSCTENDSCEQQPVSAPASVTSQNDTSAYPMEFIEEHYEFDILFEKADDWNLKKYEIECIKGIMYDVLNASDKKEFTIKGSKFQANVIKSRFLKLTKYHILSTLKKFAEISSTVRDYTGYLITMLYESYYFNELNENTHVRQSGT